MSAQAVTKKRRQRERQRMTVLPDTGFLRLEHVLDFIPVSAPVWWGGVKKGVYPKSIKLSANITVWKAEDIRALINRIGSGDENETST